MIKPKILYIEDELFLGKIVKESLEARGFEVCMMEDGRDLLKNIVDFQPHICILDIMLPFKDGFTLGKELRDKGMEVPILFLTAKSQTEDVIKGFASGGNDYLKKPFSMEELIARINNLIQLAGNTGPVNKDSISLGRYQYHANKMLVTDDTREFRLSHRENELLTFLLQRQNQVSERKEILREIWGSDSLFNSRNLDVYITRLRNYFREEPKVEILTLKGVGYRFIVH